MFEHLERRWLLAATAVLDNGVVKITGTPEDDHVGLRVHIGDATDFIVVTAEGEEILAVPLNEVTSVEARLAAGNDTLKTDPQLPRPISAFGDGGRDVLSGGAAGDLLNGGPDDDILHASRGPDDFVGGAGTDTVSYREYQANVRVTLDNQPNDGALVNAPGSNDLVPAASEGDNVRMDVEVVIGGRGNDHIEGVTSPLAVLFPAVRFEGGPGHDTLVAGHSAARAVLDGGDGNDHLIGGHQPNLLLGGTGNDRMVGNNAPDEFFGGTGFDTADYSGKTADLRITLDNLPNDGEVGTASHLAEGDNVHRDVEHVIGGSGNDHIALSAPAVTPTRVGGSIDNTANALTHIVFDGGPGNDTLVAQLPQLAVVTDEAAETGAGESELDGSGGSNTVVSLSNAKRRFFAILNGDGGSDRLVGSRLHDQLNGGPGFDTSLGNDGDDLFVASFGGDDMSGGNGIDTVNYSVFNAGVFVTIDDIANDGLPVLSPGPQDNVRLDIENVIGTRSADQISGSDRANRLDGLGGGDVIHGLGGNDTVVGGPGPDRLFGDDGDDLLISRDGEADHVDGGEGTDKAIADLLDELINIEGIAP
jgi:Ca2+-binding RTX toxin-like protein